LGLSGRCFSAGRIPSKTDRPKANHGVKNGVQKFEKGEIRSAAFNPRICNDDAKLRRSDLRAFFPMGRLSGGVSRRCRLHRSGVVTRSASRSRVCRSGTNGCNRTSTLHVSVATLPETMFRSVLRVYLNKLRKFLNILRTFLNILRVFLNILRVFLNILRVF
jgi:hypothetical protein